MIRSWVSVLEWGCLTRARLWRKAGVFLWVHSGCRTIKICVFKGHKDWCIYSVRLFIQPGCNLRSGIWGVCPLICFLSFSRSELLTSTVGRTSFPWQLVTQFLLQALTVSLMDIFLLNFWHFWGFCAVKPFLPPSPLFIYVPECECSQAASSVPWKHFIFWAEIKISFLL